MKLTHMLLSAGLCCLAAVCLAQKKSSAIPYRFATRAESQMLITDIDHFTSGLNQFDLNSRLHKQEGRKSELLTLAMNETRNWSEKDKERIDKAVKALDMQIQKQKLSINFPKEIILMKTTMNEEGNAGAYTRKNWIAIGEEVLEKMSDADLQYLMAHEIFHVLTRYDLNFKKAIYQTIGFTVMDKEIIFPSDIMEKRISNPDISRYDSYATFTIRGEKQNCTMMIYSDRPYTEGRLFDYLKIGLIPLNEQLVPIQQDGQTVIYSLDEAEDFYSQVGKNTEYTINPEEALADNFAYTLTDKKDLKNPEIQERIRKVLRNEK